MSTITIETSLLTTTLPVAVYNDGGTYKLWTQSLLPTEPVIDKIIKNSKDIESEFVDIVNENFWDLI